jgi:hypothetical protein
MRKVLAFSILSFVLLLAVGCSSGNPMVGTWKMEFSDEVKKQMPEGSSMGATAVFKDDNTFTVEVDTMGQKDSIAGTYQLEGKELTMTQTTENGQPSNEVDKATLSEDMKSFSAPGMEAMGKMVKQ